MLQYQQAALPQQIWASMVEQLSSCWDCVCSYHSACEELFTRYDPISIEPLLRVLRQLDRERLLCWLQQSGGTSGGTEEGGELAWHGLSEVLAFPHLMDDASVCAATVQHLGAVGWQLDAEDDAGLPGLCRLLAHPDQAVRSQVRAQAGCVQTCPACLPACLPMWLSGCLAASVCTTGGQ